MREVLRAVAVTAGLALLVGAAAWLVGVSWGRSALLASAVMTVGAGYAAVPLREVRWPERPTPRPPGTRSEVARLSWTLLDRNGAVERPAALRLLSLAQRRLAHRGVDLSDPENAAAAARLLGSRNHGLLRSVAADPDRPVRYWAFVRCVAAIERLGELPATGPAVAPAADGEPPS